MIRRAGGLRRVQSSRVNPRVIQRAAGLDPAVFTVSAGLNPAARWPMLIPE